MAKHHAFAIFFVSLRRSFEIILDMTPVQTSKMSNFRWVICALLFLATTVNYMDRQVL
jgi:hypothetical protein